MPEVTIKFNLPEEEHELQTALRANALAVIVDEVDNRVFRPARKHGYSDSRLNDLFNRLNELVEQHAPNDWPTDEYGKLNATDLVQLLADEFCSLRNEYLDRD